MHNLKKTLATSLLASAMAVGISAPAFAVDPVNIRVASDTSGIPHPAGIAMEIFKAIHECCCWSNAADNRWCDRQPR